MPIIDPRYTVSMQPGRLTGWKPASAAAAWYGFLLFTKNWLGEPIFREQDLVFSALPEAKRAMRPGKCLVWNQPRNACHVDAHYVTSVIAQFSRVRGST